MEKKKHFILKVFLSLIFLLTVLILPAGKVSAQETDIQSFENPVEVSSAGGYPIIYEDGIHYIEDPEYPDRYLVLYCMNNKSHWPHEQPGLSVGVPDYQYGSLTPDNFESPEKYQECMNRLDEILYTGYPYNGKLLYRLVGDGEENRITEEDFNRMLVPPRVLVECFPVLQGHVFTVDNRKEKIEVLQEFITQVAQLYPDGNIQEKLTYSQITSSPFYKAVLSITWTDGEGDPLEAYSALFPNSYLVTEEQAYDATQFAVWKLLYDYGIESNDLSDLSTSSLALTIYERSKDSLIQKEEPDVQKISIEGDTTFRYDPNDGKWHTGVLRFVEPTAYYGLYSLSLPEGISATKTVEIKDHEPFELTADQMPAENTVITVESFYSWMKETRQYSPVPDIEVDGKHFQHMAGAVVMNKEHAFTLSCQVEQTSDISIHKTVEGRMGDKTKQFPFVIHLQNNTGTPFSGTLQTEKTDQTGMSPQPGELIFDASGKAETTLGDGETLTLKSIPNGFWYMIMESDEIHKEYRVTYNGSDQKPQGQLLNNVNIQVINRKDEVPDTGLKSGTAGLMVAVCAGICAMLLIPYMSYRRKKGNHEAKRKE